MHSINSARPPLIGITAGEILNKDEPWAPVVHGQSQTYVDAIAKAGGVPVILPLLDNEDLNRQMYERCDAILFAGGNDIDPALFGETAHPSVNDVSVLRDTVEMRLMRWSLKADGRPVLGICRGMELLNIAHGGTLYQDIASALPDAADHNMSTAAKDIGHIAHYLRVEAGSRLAKLTGMATLGANTHHHQAINELGEGLRAVAWAEDGIVEAIEPVTSDGKFILGIQSHPESMERTEPAWGTVFKAFVKAAGHSKR